MADYYDDTAQAEDIAALEADRLAWVKPLLQFSILCSSTRQDEQGSLDFIGVYMGFNISVPTNTPTVGVSFSLVNGWTNGVGVYRSGVRILAPDESPVFEEERQVVLRHRAMRHAVEHGPEFPVELSGYYKIQVALDGEVMTEYLMKIVLAEGPAN